jgi:hypothetical protein
MPMIRPFDSAGGKRFTVFNKSTTQIRISAGTTINLPVCVQLNISLSESNDFIVGIKCEIILEFLTYREACSADGIEEIKQTTCHRLQGERGYEVRVANATDPIFQSIY